MSNEMTAAEHRGTERPGVENADTSGISAVPQAAHEEAERRWPTGDGISDPLPWDWKRIGLRQGFEYGARWATVSRAEPSDAEVRAAAEAIMHEQEDLHRWRSLPLPQFGDSGSLRSMLEARVCDCGESFRTQDAHHRHVYEACARAALLAAREVARHE